MKGTHLAILQCTATDLPKVRSQCDDNDSGNSLYFFRQEWTTLVSMEVFTWRTSVGRGSRWRSKSAFILLWAY